MKKLVLKKIIFTCLVFNLLFIVACSETNSIDQQQNKSEIAVTTTEMEEILSRYDIREGTFKIVENNLNGHQKKYLKKNIKDQDIITKEEFEKAVSKTAKYQNSIEGKAAFEIGHFYRSKKKKSINAEEEKLFFKMLDKKYGTNYVEIFLVNNNDKNQ